MGHDVSKEFYNVMYAGDNGKFPTIVGLRIAIFFTFIKASDLYHRVKFLVKYLEEVEGILPIQSFIQAIKQDINAGPHWPEQISFSEEVYSDTTFLRHDHLIVSTS